MAVIKFNEKNKAIFGKIEAVANVYEPGIIATDVIPATSITGSITYETEAFQFLGSSLDRNEFTYLKDSYADVQIETPQQVLGTLNPTMTVAEVPMSKYLRACGGNTSVNGGTGVVTVTNSIAEPATLSFNFDKTSISDAVNAKRFQFYGMLGMVDLSAEIGKIPTLKFAFKGAAFKPITAPILAPDFALQTTSLAREVRQATIVNAQVTPYGENFAIASVVTGTATITNVTTVATVALTAHGLIKGQLVRVRGATGADKDYYNGDFIVTSVPTSGTFTYTMNGTPAGSAVGTIVITKDGWAKTFCFSNLQAPNVFGRELSRSLTGCEESYDIKAIPTDVSVTSLETHTPSYGIASITRVGTLATVTTTTPHGLTTGDSVTIQGATDVLYNISTLATVLTATTFTYLMGGTPAASAVASSGNILIAINNSVFTFDPDLNVRKFFAAQVQFGEGAGKYITYSWDKLQLTNVKDGKVASSEGRESTYRNTSSFTLTYS